jgi:glutamate-1-semialdehyde 2,1-aminomutase
VWHGFTQMASYAANRPVIVERAEGHEVIDVDGGRYLDAISSLWVATLGHRVPELDEALSDQLERVAHSTMLGNGNRVVIELAEALAAVVPVDRPHFLFASDGAAAVEQALKIAFQYWANLGVTGRTRFLALGGAYHGDTVGSVSVGGIDLFHSLYRPLLFDSTRVAPGDLDAMDAALGRGDIAAVIMEPMMINAGAIEPAPGYLEGVRAICDRYGAILVFDEIITGFRVALGGAVERYGVTPDLATYGKAMAGGWPVAALAGRADLMERFGTAEVNHSGTFNASVMAMAATCAALRRLTEAPPYDAIAAHGTALMQGLRELGERHGVPLRVQGVPAAFHASFGDPAPVFDYRGLAALDRERYAEFVRMLAEHGVWVAGRGIWYVSAAHTDRELNEALDRVDAALQRFTARTVATTI